jgi:hypothetical protein
LRWFKQRHPELSLRVAQGLESGRAKGLSAENVASFYKNLESLYAEHEYSSDRIWNCDESGAQAGRNGGALVLAKRGSRAVHSTIPDQREWLSMLSCVNAAGSSIPNFYILRGKRFSRNYIERCESGSTMAMQSKAWMTGILFCKWISHFIKSIETKGGEISPSRRHLLILDGHGSHVTRDAVHQAQSVGLDLLTLPSHTSHAMQPLDINCFKPFKTAFRQYRDVWSLANKGRPAQKEDLCQWVSLALKKALTADNIQKGFQSAGIWPMNPRAMEEKMGPSQCLVQPECNDAQESQYIHVEEVMEENVAETKSDAHHYFVDVDGCNQMGPEVNLEGTASKMGPVVNLEGIRSDSVEVGSSTSQSNPIAVELCLAPVPPPSIARFLTLLEVCVPPRRTLSAAGEPLIDYSKLIILTADEYVAALDQKALRKEEAQKEREKKKEDLVQSKQRRDREKQEKEASKRLKAEMRQLKKSFDAQWTSAKCKEAGECLHHAIRTQAPITGYQAPYCGVILLSVGTTCR